MRIMREKSRIMPGKAFEAGSIPATGTNERKLKYGQAGAGILQGSFQAYGSRKDGEVPGIGQRCERRDGFLIARLVMSINISRISY